LLVALLLGCSKSKSSGVGPAENRGAPPPTHSSELTVRPSVCKEGGGQVKDAVSAPFFPRQAGAFCINPEGETQAFGEKAPKPIDGICSLFDGGCELYRTHQVKRTVSLDYVDGAGSSATINVVLSQFATPDHSFAMFTRRVTSDEDPARSDMPKSIDVGAPAALGTGSLYAWRGPYLLELSYVNTDEDEKQMRAMGEQVLPLLAKQIVTKLPGTLSLPVAVAQLPSEKQVPLGVSLLLTNVLAVDGIGAGALGYYRDGEKRYRIAVIRKADAEQAKDALKTFRKQRGAQEEKNVGEGAVRVMLQEQPDDPKVEWLVGRQGTTLVGIGDESFVLKPGSAAADHEKVSLPLDEKRKRLQTILPTLK